MEHPRVRLQFRNFTPGRGGDCWYLVDRSKCKTVGDFVASVQHSFCIGSVPLKCSTKNYELPIWENIAVIRDDDDIVVEERTSQELVNESFLDSKEEEEERIENSFIPAEVDASEAREDLSSDRRCSKKKKKNKKREINLLEVSHDISENESDGKEVKKHKKKHKKETLEKEQKISNNVKEDQDADDADKIVTKRKRRLPTDTETENQKNKKYITHDLIANEGCITEESNISLFGKLSDDFKTNSHKKTSKKRKKNKFSGIHDFETKINDISCTSASGSKKVPSSSFEKVLETEKCKDLSFEILDSKAKVFEAPNGLSRQSAKNHIFFGSDDEDSSKKTSTIPLAEDLKTLFEHTKKIPEKQSYGNLQKVTHSNTSVSKPNTQDFRPDSPIITNGELAVKTTNKNEAKSSLVGDSCFDSFTLANKTTEADEEQKIEVTKNYDSFIALQGPPRVGDKIAFKILELSLSYTPEISDYKEATVQAINGNGKVTLSLTENSQRKKLGDGSFTRKFELDSDEEGYEEVLEVNWKELIQPKLL